MFEGARARWAMARRHRVRQVLDRLPDESVDESAPTWEPGGLLFVTDQRLVVQDHDAMTETSIPWTAITSLRSHADGDRVRLVLELDSPAGEPDRVSLLTEEQVVAAARARSRGRAPD